MGGPGGQKLTGTLGRDVIVGGGGNDRSSALLKDMICGGRATTTSGRRNRDKVYGEEGNDLLDGPGAGRRSTVAAATDILIGECGGDELHGGGGRTGDRRDPGRQDVGRSGEDVLIGGQGSTR